VALEVFTGPDLPTLLATIRTTLGPDACVMQVKRRGTVFELIASDAPVAPAAKPAAASYAPPVSPRATGPKPVADATPEFHDVLHRTIDRAEARVSEPGEAPRVGERVVIDAAAPAPRPAYMPRPWIVALIGPTGAGKTTTIAKLATSGEAFSGCRVGFLGLDTYRIGAADQLGTYAELGDIPCEIVYSTPELPAALKRLRDCEVVLVDTPGRGPRNADDTELVRGWLQQIAPDEIHLALPSGQLPAVTRRLLRAFAPFRSTHLLATKLDEHPAESAVFDLAVEHGLPMRWTTDGQEVPADLHAATQLLSQARARRGISEGALVGTPVHGAGVP
jgi:flagellar biosynthesis GTPase FlhF